MKYLAHLWRVIKWAVKSLWRKYPHPTILHGYYSRSSMRKLYKAKLCNIDREYNRTRYKHLLYQRRILVSLRRRRIIA